MCEFDPRADYVKVFDVETTTGTMFVYGRRMTPELAVERVRREGLVVIGCKPTTILTRSSRDAYRAAYPHVWEAFPAMN